MKMVVVKEPSSCQQSGSHPKTHGSQVRTARGTGDIFVDTPGEGRASAKKVRAKKL